MFYLRRGHIWLNKYPYIYHKYTDNIGDDSYNMKLSKNRANAVMSYLIDKGIDKSRLTAKGYGETQPVATNDTDEGRAQNRRTEVKVISK